MKKIYGDSSTKVDQIIDSSTIQEMRRLKKIIQKYLFINNLIMDMCKKLKIDILTSIDSYNQSYLMKKRTLIIVVFYPSLSPLPFLILFFFSLLNFLSYIVYVLNYWELSWDPLWLWVSLFLSYHSHSFHSHFFSRPQKRIKYYKEIEREINTKLI